MKKNWVLGQTTMTKNTIITTTHLRCESRSKCFFDTKKQGPLELLQVTTSLCKPWTVSRNSFALEAEIMWHSWTWTPNRNISRWRSQWVKNTQTLLTTVLIVCTYFIYITLNNYTAWNVMKYNRTLDHFTCSCSKRKQGLERIKSIQMDPNGLLDRFQSTSPSLVFMMGPCAPIKAVSPRINAPYALFG